MLPATKPGVDVGVRKNATILNAPSFFHLDVPGTRYILGGAAKPTAGQKHNTKQRRPHAISSCLYCFGRLLARRSLRGDRYPSPGKSKSTATLALARQKRRGAFLRSLLARRDCFVSRSLSTMAARLTLLLCSSGAACLSPARYRCAWQLYPTPAERDAETGS